MAQVSPHALAALVLGDPEFLADLDPSEWIVLPYVLGLLPESSAPWHAPAPSLSAADRRVIRSGLASVLEAAAVELRGAP